MKKMTAIRLPAFLILIALILTGCNKEQAELSDDISVNTTYIFSPVFVSLPDEVDTYNSDLFSADDRIYIKYIIPAGNQVESMLFSVDLNGENLQNIPFSAICAERDKSTITQLFTGDRDGNKIYIESEHTVADGTVIYTLLKTSADGQMIFETDITNIFDDDTANNSTGSFYLMTADGVSGNIYLARENAIAAISPSGEKVFEVTSPEKINRISAMPDGRILVLYGDTYTNNLTYSIVDPSAQTLNADVKIPPADSLTGYDIYTGDGYDLYLKTRETLYGYNFSDNGLTEVCNWINSGIDGTVINNIIILSADKFAVVYTDNITLQKQLALLTQTSDNRTINKTIIKMAYISLYTDPFWTSTVAAFNAQSDNYRIEPEDYDKYNTVANDMTGLNTLQKDFLTDKAPDILLLDPNISTEDFADKGAFTDIYGFMGDDFTRDNLLGYATAPFEIDGKLFSLPLCVSVWTRAADKSLLNDKNGWTLEDMYALTQTAEADGNKLFPPHITKLNLFSELVNTNITTFVDKENKTCSFDGETFANLLEYCNTYPDSVPPQEMMEFQKNQSGMYRSGKIKIYFLTMNSVSSYLSAKYIFGTDDIALIGSPATPDSGNGAVVFPVARISVSAKSTATDGIREYIKYLLSDKIQASPQMKNLPVTTGGLKAHTDYYRSKYYYFEENGAVIPFAIDKDDTDNNPYEGNKAYYKTELTEADVDYLIGYFNGIKTSYDSNRSIIDIATEEVQPYFAGDKSITEAAEIIQSRAGVYVAETG